MVGVRVGVEDGVEAVDAFAHGLGAEVGRGVDDDIAAVVGKQDRWARAFVVRISGIANGAMTRESGHAHRGARAKNG